MKTFSMSRDSNTFTSALKGIRKHLSTASSSQKDSKSNDYNNYLQKASSLSKISSSKTNIIRRKNLTLQQLFCEYETNPDIQYVVRLKTSPNTQNQYGGFDGWVANLKPEINRTNKFPSVSTLNDKLIDPKKESKADRRKQIQKQISQNLLKMTEKIHKKESQNTQSTITQGNSPINREAKYSFSQYFSQFSQPQAKNSSSRAIVTTKVSIASDKNVVSFTADQIVKDSPQQNSESTKNSKNRSVCQHNKENSGDTSNICPQNYKVMGLEFVKNKRFKSTKKKRKPCS